MRRPTQARIDVGRLRRNAALARQLAPDSRLMAVLKADAYGHGAVAVARALGSLCDGIAVATLDEACVLRTAGIRQPILLLEGVFSPEELPLAAELGLALTVHQQEQIDWLRRARLPRAVCCWLKIDTGMHRLGFAVEQARAAWQALRALPCVQQEIVLCSHLAHAQAPASPRTSAQIQCFDAVCEGLPGPRSLANSAALLSRPDSHRDWVRPGYLLFGDSPFDRKQALENTAVSALEPVMTLCSAVIAVREIAAGDAVGYGEHWIAKRPTCIATVATGYADGYPCRPGAAAVALVNGERAPLAGRVSMDMLMLDVSDLPPVQPGDPVVLWGPGLPVGEVAAHAGTLGYELLARMPARVPRVLVATEFAAEAAQQSAAAPAAGMQYHAR